MEVQNKKSQLKLLKEQHRSLVGLTQKSRKIDEKFSKLNELEDLKNLDNVIDKING